MEAIAARLIPRQILNRIMQYDKDGDGKLTKDEVSDARLQPLLSRADADQDGVVSKEELSQMMAKEMAARGGTGRGFGGTGGSGFGGPGFGGPGGGGPPKIGEILPSFMQESLELTARQKKMLEVLQADVDKRLARILTEEQFQQLEEMQSRGPGGPGGPGGEFGGPPPAGEGRPRRPGGPRDNPPDSE